RGFKNEDYTRRKRLMENYLLEYLPGGYHLFINLFEQLFETPDNKMLKLPALEKWFLEESRRFGADRPLLDSFANVVRLALTAERVLPKKIYSLHPPMMSATFSQEQCAALLAQRFFKNDMIG
uniref:Uncharacterized protein n=1 Tax=Caenorhabditis japonica TaxID=281687 RepID=A0A8R1IAH2_CAEJA